MAIVGPVVVNGQDLGVHVVVRAKRPTTAQAQRATRDAAKAPGPLLGLALLEPAILGALLPKSRSELRRASDGVTIEETRRPAFRALLDDSERRVLTCSRGHRNQVSRRQLLRRAAAGETTIAP